MLEHREGTESPALRILLTCPEPSASERQAKDNYIPAIKLEHKLPDLTHVKGISWE